MKTDRTTRTSVRNNRAEMPDNETGAKLAKIQEDAANFTPDRGIYD